MSTTPFTFVAMTYNLWGGRHLDLREAPLRAFFATRAPDILLVQELCAETRQLIDEVLVEHARVDDPFEGWVRHGNIWWRREAFELVEYGAEDVGIRSRGARLFWTRLQPAGRSERLLVSTAHFTWQGHPQEREDEVNPRTEQARRTVTELTRLDDGRGEATLFGGDVNDFARPIWAFREGGFCDSFAGLGGVSPATHPVVPTADAVAGGGPVAPSASKALDWLFHRGPIVPRTSEVVDFFHAGIAPSDHHPVVATYTLTS